MKFIRNFIIFILSIFVANNVSLAADSEFIQKRLKELTSMDFKVVSNKPLSDASMIILQSPEGEKLVFLASSDGKFIIPLSNALPLGESKSTLQTTMNEVNEYNRNLKDSKVLKLFQKYSKYTLKIPSASKTNKTTYMVLDTTCPYCLQEINKLDSYLKDSNLEILMVAFLGPKAQKRTAGYYEELQKVTPKNDKNANINLLKKVFTKEYDPKSGDDKITKEITESTIAADVQGVPYIVKK